MMHVLMIDALEQQTLLSLKHSLQQAATLLALQTRQSPLLQLGLCAIRWPTPKDVQLQVPAMHYNMHS